MKTALLAGLIAIMFTDARLATAQVLNDDVGVTLGGTWNPGGPLVIVWEAGTEGQVTQIGDQHEGQMGITSALPGDLILANLNDLDSRSDWLADIRFFNPLDPTGSLGLPATETEAFFPDDLGPGGFGAFQLFPNYNVIPGGMSDPDPFDLIDGPEILFGPLGGVDPGQEAIIIFTAYPIPHAAGTPEPSGLALLLGVGVVGAGLVARRRHNFAQA